MLKAPDPRQRMAPIGALARPAMRLFLTSAAILFTELLLIRWVPANVKYVGFFSNFLLMASFLGIGLGILLGRRAPRLLLSPFPLLLLPTVLLVYGAQLNVKVEGAGEVFFGLEASHSADVNFVVLPMLVILVTALMAAIALPLGPLLKSMAPLRAYAIDIVGSMSGIAGFAVLSYLGTDPTVWFGVLGVLLLLLALGVGPTPWSILGGVAMLMVVVSSALVAQASLDMWSPYYRITAWTEDGARTSISSPKAGPPYAMFVDGIPHQAMLDSTAAAASPMHDQAYRWFPDRVYDDVLIIGAGSGSDVSLALARGARHVDAVEIDPVLAEVGREFHPEGVYTDPRVSVYVNDGRAFLNGTGRKYDLIVLGLTDSLTLASSMSNVRLESFLFTTNAFEAARDRLAPGGLFVMYNLYREPWIVSKLDAMLGAAFGPNRLVRLTGPAEAVLAAGPAVDALAGGSPPGDAADPPPDTGQPVPRLATDDWPFLYLRVPDIASYYLVALGFLLLLAVASVLGAARLTATPIRRFNVHFFALGVAFLLLETRSLVSFSLLFGTTWIVNAMAFFAILASVLLAILINARLRMPSPAPLYVALFGSIAVAFLVPTDSLLIDPPEVRYLLASIIAFAPVFFANLVFTYSFRDTAEADMAFASNLLGAMLGGALEYVALLTGFRSLLLVVALCYGAAFVLYRRRGVTRLTEELAVAAA
jgi:SAM-dependent methyltransferase